MSNSGEIDPVTLIANQAARTEAYRCPSCRAVENRPAALPTFGATCGVCGARVSSKDVFFYAPIWRRLFALVMDVIAFALPTIAINIVVASWEIEYAPKDEVGDLTYAAVVWITATEIAIAITVLLGYLILGNATGKSAGKLITGLRVVRLDTGDAPGLATSVVRTSAQFLTVLTLGVSYAILAFDQRRRTLHDRIARTIVIER